VVVRRGCHRGPVGSGRSYQGWRRGGGGGRGSEGHTRKKKVNPSQDRAVLFFKTTVHFMDRFQVATQPGRYIHRTNNKSRVADWQFVAWSRTAPQQSAVMLRVRVHTAHFRSEMSLRVKVHWLVICTAISSANFHVNNIVDSRNNNSFYYMTLASTCKKCLGPGTTT
jgi:hypothetical protein